MKVKLYNQKKEEIGDVELPKEVFEIKMNSDLVHQVVLAQQTNKRQKSAKAKDRGEVKGGGRKPWRQKGTGRARVGSIRSPIWKGGGVTFGPVSAKILKKKIPIKMRRKALFMVLSSKAENKSIFVLDKLKIEKAKTKEMNEILSKFFKKSSGKITESVLIALDKKDDNAIKAGRNIPKIDIMEARELNVLDLLNHKHLLMTKEAINIIKKTFMRVRDTNQNQI